MSRLLPLLSSCVAALAVPVAASAHFAFVVPDDSGSSARVMMSETLTPDTDVPVAILSNAQLAVRAADGREVPLELGQPDGDVFNVDLPGDGTRVVRGLVDLGYTQRGNGTPHLLIYHPKAIVGDAFDPATQLGWSVPVELIPVGEPGDARLKLVASGVPQPEAEVTIVHPDGAEEVVITDADGLTPVLDGAGRYGAWARHWQDVKGERDGESFEQIRHYAMLVFTLRDAGETAVADTTSTDDAVVTLPAMPEAVASHGAVASDGWLYVYGGHIAPTHEYHRDAVSGQFHRVRLDDLESGAAPTWEALPAGRPLQGMNLGATDGKIYLIGGMQPQNDPGTPEDNRSVAEAKVFDPASGSWSDLPLMPEPRSSHDVAIIEDTLYVVGGWDMHGDGETWASDMLALDLSAESPRWERIEQPFQRRALIAAVDDGKLYVIGGMNSDEEIPNRVDIYDPASGEWSRGPDLPAGQFNGFSPAAAVLHGDVYASVADGSLLRLSDDGSAWAPVAQTSPRVVHRVIPDGDRLLLVGGAWRGGNLDLIEAVEIEGAEPVADAGGGQLLCPIMTDVPVSADDITVEYQGKQVRLCCKRCLARWTADPARYAKVDLLPQLADR